MGWGVMHGRRDSWPAESAFMRLVTDLPQVNGIVSVFSRGPFETAHVRVARSTGNPGVQTLKALS
jgi:hypothetical protein